MDVTVTAPLETGAGHQRLVVAYTLKQGIEKQPDILSAQKSAPTGGDASSPLGNRPSGLFAGGGGGGAGGASGAPMTGNTGGHKTTDYVSASGQKEALPSDCAIYVAGATGVCCKLKGLHKLTSKLKGALY